MSEPSELQKMQNQGIYRLGGLCAFLSVAGSGLDIVIASIPGWGVATVPKTALEWFALFQTNTLHGLYTLDLLNVIISLLFIPVVLALFLAQRREQFSYAALAVIVALLGIIVFVANNAALPMLGLSSKYALAATDAQKGLLAAAGEAMLAKGQHGGPGVLWGFVFQLIANLIMSGVMLKAKVFSKATAYVGMLGFLILMLYIVVVTFMPQMQNAMMLFAMPGGLLAIAWNVMVGIRLFQLGRGNA